ncbi:MAG TPA: alanine--tRNA ligase [Steroidobacteraceae bacterium]|nr:alanine--tRNA ligase [Steroidobacteraceae bacterium]
MPTGSEIRARFLEFFETKGHKIVHSSSLVPQNDPTLLFTNAGMNQFKDVFLGLEKRDYNRATTSQKCVRAGGKHNDLENVGFTNRHHTFFEMLGNFSFGDYFKKDAVAYAWELLTSPEWFNIPKEKLYVTIFEGMGNIPRDDEAERLWLEVDMQKDRIFALGMKDNFWQMGDTGPCGPCTEIFHDHGPEIPGGPPGSPDAEGDRWIEIWNLVFMQFDRSAEGKLAPLPKPSVDTGMGLERVSAVMQGVHSIYDIDLFQHLIRAADALAVNKGHVNSLQVVADHIRATSFLILDGVTPSNEGRGYVLRRIMRRALRHGWKLGTVGDFLWRMVAPLAAQMGDAYPELRTKQAAIETVIRAEEQRFAQTLDSGMTLLETALRRTGGSIPGTEVFRLYDTYGFPPDLTADIARERGVAVDLEGFEREMDAQRDRARAASKFGADLRDGVKLDAATEFRGYDRLTDEARVLALVRDGAAVDELKAGERGQVVLDHTPFYAESGGQVGDTGNLTAPGISFRVDDTQKLGDAHAHIGEVKQGTIKPGSRLTASVDSERRAKTVLNHSATHLLHAALRKVLGTHVTQKGSLVAPDRLRFDFSHFQAVTSAELRQIENLVNREIRANAAADIRVMPYDDALKAGAMALFGEKYGDEVRVLKLGDFSTELCGGTHVERAGDIGFFKIVGESGVAAGVRRIEAITGQAALDYAAASDQLLRDVAGLVRGGRDDIEAKVRGLIEHNRRLEKDLSDARNKLASGQGKDLGAQAIDLGGVKLVVSRIDGVDGGALRETVDKLKDKLKSAVIVLGAVDAASGKVALVAGVTADQASRLKAGELVGMVAAQVGGKGGGRPDFAQAGGTEPQKLDAALASVEPWVRDKLSPG